MAGRNWPRVLGGRPSSQGRSEGTNVTALLLAAIVIVALDQSTKSLALAKLREGRVVAVGFVAIRTVLNRRMGWIIWNSEAAPVLLLLVEFVLLAAVVQFGGFFTDAVAPAALGAAIGGASSNLIDRLWRGGVVDFSGLRCLPASERKKLDLFLRLGRGRIS